jgi:hypothetical protein
MAASAAALFRRLGSGAALLALSLSAVSAGGCNPAQPEASPPTTPTTGVGGNGAVPPSTWPPPAPPAPTPPAAPGLPLGPPVSAPDNQWTWVDVAGSHCADGSATGFGINPNSASKNLLIFIEGGGACWDADGCWGAVPTSFYMTGYNGTTMTTDPQLLVLYILSRSDTTNPFKDWNLVFVPYCTGDAFSGAAVTNLVVNGANKPTYFVGSANMKLFLERIVPTFPDAQTVYLGGDSAGGFGAAFSYNGVRAAFPDADVNVLDDSGQPIAPDPARWATMLNTWNIALPSDCVECVEGPQALVDYYARHAPAGKFGLISYEYDTIIAPFMNLSEAQFQTELYAQLDHMDATWPNGRYFVIAGSSHVGLLAPTTAMRDWISAMVTNSPGWTSTRP